MALGHGRGALKPFSFYVPAVKPVNTAPQRGFFSVDGNFGVLALGAAIGAAAIFSGTAITPRFPQPEPQDAQWGFAQRNWDQPAPFFSGQTVGQRAPTDLQRTFVVPPQEDPTQIQPWFSTQNYTARAKTPLNRSFGAASQDDPSQIQPWVSKQVPVSVAQTPTPNKQWFSWQQDDPTQIQPQTWRQQLASPAVSVPNGQWFKPPQEDPTQLQPFFVGQTIGQRVRPPLEPIWTASPQADPWQIQPWNSHQAPPSQAVTQPTPQVSQWGFANRQWDQPQPVFSRAPITVVQIPASQGTLSPNQVEEDRQPRFFNKQIVPSQAPAKPIPTQFVASPQADPTQIQPWKSSALPGNLSPIIGWLDIAAPQQTESDRQPQVFKQFIGTSQVQTATPNRTWFAFPQDNLNQIQPEFWSQQLDLMALSPGGTLTPLQYEEDRQPRIWRAAFIQSQFAQTPIPEQFFATPQFDPTQLAAWFTGQVPPSQPHQTPPWKSFFAQPQADPTQLQPVFSHIAVIPTFVAPAKPNIIKAGIWSSGNTIYAGVRNG